MIADTLMEAPLMENGQQYPVLYKSYPDDSSMASRNLIAYRLRQGLSFSQPEQQSHLIDVYYQSPSPLEAAAVVNLTISEYNQLSTIRNRQSAGSAAAFLNKESRKIHRELETTEKNLAHYRNSHQVVQLSAQTQSLIQRTAELEQSRQKARTLLVAAKSGIKQYKQQLNKIKPGLAEQYIQAIGPSMERLQYALAELKTKKTKLFAKNPSLAKSTDPPRELQVLNRKIKLYKDTISTRVKKMLSKGGEYLNLMGSNSGGITQSIAELNAKLINLNVKKQQYQSQVNLLTKQINDLNDRFNNLPENMLTLARLKRQAEINQDLYVTVAKQQAQMALWRQTRFSTGQLVDKGYIPGFPVKPRKKLYLIIGFIVGGILGMGFIFLKETYNNTIDGVEKLKRFELPVLSVVPDIHHYIKKEFKGRKTVKVRGKQVSTQLICPLRSLSPAAESIRRLESNILYSNPDTKVKSLLITSSKSGEGKSLIAANLAATMTEAGKEVILLDTDLRRPKIHKIFGVERSPGIREVLFDQVALSDAIRPTIIPGLSILTTGKQTTNPSAIKKSDRFQSLIGRLRHSCDYLLLDSAPFGIIADSSSHINQVDNVVVVCRFGETKKGELKQTLERLSQIDANVLGTVLNAFKVEKSSDYYYGQNYYQFQYKNYEVYEKKE